MIDFIKKLFNNQVVRYVFFGGCTTLVNIVSYYILRHVTPLGITPANIISITLAIIFAFVTNSRFVFHSQAETCGKHLVEFIKFFGMRLSTMAIEVGGVALFVWMHMNDMLAKVLIQFVVLVLNYVFSKFFVFIKRNSKG